MANFSSAVVTDLGAQQEAYAKANGYTLNFSGVTVGKGLNTANADIDAFTALINQVMSANIIGYNNLVQYQVTVRFDISSLNVPVGQGFQLTEAGLWATVNGGAPFLYAYAYAGTGGDNIPDKNSGSPVDEQYTLDIPISNAPTITVTVNLQQPVNLHGATHLKNGIDPLPLSSLTDNGVVGPTPGDGLQAWTSTNPPSFKPSLRVITANATLYVSTTGNDSTAIIGDPTHPWATLPGALASLRQYYILNNVTVTISIGAGVWNPSSTIVLQHPQGTQVQIIAAAPIPYTIRSFDSVSGSGVNRVAHVTFTSTPTGLVANDFLVVGSGGIGQDQYLCGCWEVQSVTGLNAVLAYPVANYGGVIGTCSNMPAWKLPTVFSFTQPGTSDCFQVPAQNKIGLLENICITSSSTTPFNGTQAFGLINVYSGASLDLGNFVGLNGGGNLCGITDDYPGANVTIGTVYISCVGAHGIDAEFGGSIMCASCFVNGCGQDGVNAIWGSNITFWDNGNAPHPMVASVQNGQSGFLANNQSGLFAIFHAYSHGNATANYSHDPSSNLFVQTQL